MSDTLRQYAVKSGLKKGETVALFYKQRHYIATRNLDSILFYTDVIRKFCRDNRQKNYYYLAWRYLANYYIQEGYFNLALKEIQDMPKEATKDEYIQGVIESYGMLARLYYDQKLYDKAIENMELALAMDEEYGIDDFNIFSKHLLITLCCIDIRDFDKAESHLKLGLENSKSNVMTAEIYRGYIKLYIEKGELTKARNYLDTVLQAKYVPKDRASDILSLEAQYYLKKGDYGKALSKYEDLGKIRPVTFDVLKNEALCLSMLGNIRQSNEKLLRALNMRDSLDIVAKEHSVMEQMVLMEVESINAEKDKLSLRLREARLNYAKIMIGVMMVLLVIFIYLTWKYHKTNVKLIKSENVKGKFINHLSHEIRTPLNSILGFSDLIAEGSLTPEEMEKCSIIIHENSNFLLRMISEAMDIADVGSIGTYLKDSINDICLETVEAARTKAKKDVPIFLIPSKSDRQGMLNKQKIVKILNALLDNAIRFTKKGSITVEVRTVTINFDNKIVITITDTGIGIPINSQDTVFKFFEKIDEYNPGLGLGLSVSRLLAESMNGSLEIDKDYADGTRMVLIIPLK